MTFQLGRAQTLRRAGQISGALGILTQIDTAALTTNLECAIYYSELAECRLARGEIATARSLQVALAPLLLDKDLPGALACVSWGEVCAAVGDHDGALAHFEAAGEIAGADSTIAWWAGAAMALARTQRVREAAEVARTARVRAQAAGSAYHVALAMRTSAAVDSGIDRHSLLRDARRVIGDIPAARLAAQIDTDLAALLLLTSDEAHGVEAIMLLRSAEEYALSEQLRPLASRVARLIERAGESPGPMLTQIAATSTLTRAETRVASLAAVGLSNREIAAHLSVSVKAIEGHLSNVYRKLSITSRKGLATSIGVPA